MCNLLGRFLFWLNSIRRRNAKNLKPKVSEWTLVPYDFRVDWFVSSGENNCKLIRPRPESFDRPSL